MLETQDIEALQRGGAIFRHQPDQMSPVQAFAVVMAIKSTLSPDTHFATIHAETRFLYPVKEGIVTAKAEATINDDLTIRGAATVFDQTGKPVLEFHSTFKIAKNRKIKKS